MNYRKQIKNILLWLLDYKGFPIDNWVLYLRDNPPRDNFKAWGIKTNDPEAAFHVLAIIEDTEKFKQNIDAIIRQGFHKNDAGRIESFGLHAKRSDQYLFMSYIETNSLLIYGVDKHENRLLPKLAEDMEGIASQNKDIYIIIQAASNNEIKYNLDADQSRRKKQEESSTRSNTRQKVLREEARKKKKKKYTVTLSKEYQIEDDEPQNAINRAKKLFAEEIKSASADIMDVEIKRRK